MPSSEARSFLLTAQPATTRHCGAQKALEARYRDVRAASFALAASLRPEDQQAQATPDASPVKWHLAHGSWFSETLVLLPSLAGYERFDPAYGYLFNYYYEISYLEDAAFATWAGGRLPYRGGLGTRRGDRARPLRAAVRAGMAVVGEYNGKFLVGQMVLKGAAAATPLNHSRPSYRNFFQPHQRWMFAVLRLASNMAPHQ